MKPSGPEWCELFPTSRSVDDLSSPFKEGVIAFLRALDTAGVLTIISATYRPPERAYLMHWSCRIAGYRDKAQVFHQVQPHNVPAMQGVEIDWTCGGDLGKARAAAVAMKRTYNIVFPAALNSRHTKRRAIDMTFYLAGQHQVQNARGERVKVSRLSDLYPVGESYGVRKLISDPPHWSDNGH